MTIAKSHENVSGKKGIFFFLDENDKKNNSK